MKKLLTFILIILFGLIFGSFKPLKAVSPDYEVLFTELQVGISGKSSHEFFEIKNQDSTEKNIQILYANPTSQKWDTKTPLFKGKIADNAIFLFDNEKPKEDPQFLPNLNNSSGALAMFTSTDPETPLADENILDCIIWGNEFSQNGEFTQNCQQLEGMPVSEDESFQRFFGEDSKISAEFTIHSPVSPGEILNSESQKEDVPVVEDPEIEYPNIIISEVLPDPAQPKADSNYEFIELYNPNQEAVNLKNFKLQSGNDFRYEFIIPAITIEPNQYLALYSSETKLTLSNSGSKVRILDPSGKELNKIQYLESKEDYSWVWQNNKWQLTSESTPNKENKLVIPKPGRGSSENSNTNQLKPCREDQFRNPSTNRCKKKGSNNELKLCKEGQTRNPETNRCRRISTLASSLKPCREGQFRNSATNRCKNLASTTSELKPCKPNQERNPETNRCRKKDSSENLLKPCKEGQERNPDTNRCRNIAASSTSGNLPSSGSGLENSTNFKYIMAIGAFALVYSLWQYKDDLRMKFWQIKQRFKPDQNPQ